jgi:hypothetical protein
MATIVQLPRDDRLGNLGAGIGAGVSAYLDKRENEKLDEEFQSLQKLILGTRDMDEALGVVAAANPKISGDPKRMQLIMGLMSGKHPNKQMQQVYTQQGDAVMVSYKNPDDFLQQVQANNYNLSPLQSYVAVDSETGAMKLLGDNKSLMHAQQRANELGLKDNWQVTTFSMGDQLSDNIRDALKNKAAAEGVKNEAKTTADENKAIVAFARAAGVDPTILQTRKGSPEYNTWIGKGKTIIEEMPAIETQIQGLFVDKAASTLGNTVYSDMVSPAVGNRTAELVLSSGGTPAQAGLAGMVAAITNNLKINPPNSMMGGIQPEETNRLLQQYESATGISYEQMPAVLNELVEFGKVQTGNDKLTLEQLVGNLKPFDGTGDTIYSQQLGTRTLKFIIVTDNFGINRLVPVHEGF